MCLPEECGGRGSPTLEDQNLRATVQLEPNDQRLTLAALLAIGLGVGDEPSDRSFDGGLGRTGPKRSELGQLRTEGVARDSREGGGAPDEGLPVDGGHEVEVNHAFVNVSGSEPV